MLEKDLMKELYLLFEAVKERELIIAKSKSVTKSPCREEPNSPEAAERKIDKFFHNSFVLLRFREPFIEQLDASIRL